MIKNDSNVDDAIMHTADPTPCEWPVAPAIRLRISPGKRFATRHTTKNCASCVRPMSGLYPDEDDVWSYIICAYSRVTWKGTSTRLGTYFPVKVSGLIRATLIFSWRARLEYVAGCVATPPCNSLHVPRHGADRKRQKLVVDCLLTTQTFCQILRR